MAGTAVCRAWRAGKPASSRLGAAGIAAVAVIGWTRLAQGTPASGWLAMPPAAVACSAVYVLIGMLVLALAAGYQLRGIRRVPGQPSGPAEHEYERYEALSRQRARLDSALASAQSVQAELPGPFSPDHDREVTAYVEGEISAAELYRRTVARYRQP